MSDDSLLPVPRSIDRSKIEGYLLHPVNSRGKVAFFLAYGFALPQWQELHDALLHHAESGTVLQVVSSPYGSRYTVRGKLRTPSRREPPPVVCAVWQADNGQSGVRLITAYPA
jgi:hypothetical protein